MWEALGTVRDLGRLQEIARVLVRYGFGDAVRRIGLAGALERAGRLVHWHAAGEGLLQLDTGSRMRAALQEMGPLGRASCRGRARRWDVVRARRRTPG